MRADTRYRFEIDNKLTFRIAIAGMKGFTETRATLDQMPLSALRTGDSGLIGFINQLGMLAFGIATAADKHTKAPLA